MLSWRNDPSIPILGNSFILCSYRRSVDSRGDGTERRLSRHTRRGAKSDMTAYLDKLNAQQRRAVEHGGSELAEAGPLLIIAGAGSGKTNTLAHRVAHLIVNGADPRRMLLLTFSRRAAAEMSRRAAHITAGALQERGGANAAAMSWSGTFHAIGARLLREYAERIGLDRAFTIHDREDSADLMNLIRHDLGYSQTERAFPRQEHLHRDLFAHRQCRNSARRSARQPLSMVRRVGSGTARALAAYVEAKQRQHVLDYDDLLLYWAQMMTEPALAADVAERFDHVLVDEYQDTNRLQAAILLALKPNGEASPWSATMRSRSTRSAPRRCATFSTFPASSAPAPRSITLEHNYRSTQPILAAANAVIELAAERFTKNLRSDRASAERPYLVSVRGRSRAGALRRRAHSALPRVRAGAQESGRAVSHIASQRPARNRADAAQHPVRQIRRPAVSRSLAHQRRARVPALLRKPAATGSPVFAPCSCCPASDRRPPAARLMPWPTRADPVSALAALTPPAPPAADWPDFVETFQHVRSSAAGWPAELDRICRWYEPHLRAHPRRRRHAPGRPDTACPDRAGLIRAANASSPN